MARKPFRSPLLGYLLMSAGGAGLLSILLVNWRPGNQPREGAVLMILGLIFVSPTLIMLGAALVRRDATPILANPENRPIVYLRPFTQETVSSPGNEPWKTFIERFHLNPMNVAVGSGLLGAIGGVVAGLLHMLGGALATAGAVFALVCFVPVYLLLLYAPFHVYRMMRGRVDVTLEQELCHHFRGHGPIVAIGRPGELFAPEGGARVYLDDESWQSVVLDAIRRARIIVVHLVPEGWTWWEFCQSLASGSPTRILAVVVGRFFTDESYALLRRKVEQEFGIVLSETRPACALLSLDACRTPHYLALKRKPWFLWPFVSYRLSRHTFSPFLAHLVSGSSLKSS